MDKLRQADQLLNWAEQTQLTAAQLQQAQQQIALHPAIADWLALAQRILLSGAVILAACAVIFFFAHNWPLMHYLSKLALAGAFVLLSGVLATLLQPQSPPQTAALLACALLSGALLALIGQTYQTGADIWQLFAGWAALITPLALLARSRLCYLLWFAVIELALLRYTELHGSYWQPDRLNTLLLLTLANALLWLFSYLVLPRLGVANNRQLHWLAMLACILPAMLGAVSGLWETRYQSNLLLFVLLALPAVAWFKLRRPDLLVLALWLFSSIAVATSALARLLQDTDDLLSFNLLALFVIGSSAAAASWLRRQLQQQGAV